MTHARRRLRRLATKKTLLAYRRAPWSVRPSVAAGRCLGLGVDPPAPGECISH